MEESFSPMMALPPELLERIASYLPREDLLTLRQMCKDIDRVTFPFFKESYFTEPAYLLNDERSMATLRDVSAHPIFGRSVRKVYLTLWDVPESWDQYLECQDVDEMMVLSEHKQNWESMLAQATEFWDGPLERCLTDALLNFMRLDNIPAIVVAGDEFGAPWGMARRIALLDEQVQYCPNSGIYYDFIIDALKEAKYPLVHFETRACCPALRRNQLSLPFSQSVKQTLRTLKLVVAALDSYSDWELDPEGMDDVRFLGFLSECEGVESFSLSIESHRGPHRASDDFIFNCIAADVEFEDFRVFPRLQTLELDRQHINVKLLKQFLAARASSLEAVRLRYISDPPDVAGHSVAHDGHLLMQDLWNALDGKNKTNLTLDLRESYGMTMCWQTDSAAEKLGDSKPWIYGLSFG